jgi:hypothetical protein
MFRRQPPLLANYAPAPLNDAAVPPFAAIEADEDEESEAGKPDLDYELPRGAWRPLPPGEPPEDAPVRFIDGSIVSRTVGLITVGGRRRPLIAATVAAAALELDGRTLRRAAGTRLLKLLCFNSNGVEGADLQDTHERLRDLGIELHESDAEQPADFDTMRRAARGIAMNVMAYAEGAVLREAEQTPTLVDGPVERCIGDGRRDIPAVGLIKRQLATYLPEELQELAYSLKPGERTPAFVLQPEIGPRLTPIEVVSCYLRLSSPAGAAPSYGIVRLSVPREYVERYHDGPRLEAYLSGLAGYLYNLRHRDYAYARAGISIEPIVRVEEHLEALRPDIEALVLKLNRLLTPSPVEVTA